MSFEKLDLDDPAHQTAAVLASEWSHNSGRMVPFTPSIMEDYPYSLLAFGDSGQLLGHIAIAGCEAGAGMVGGLIVNPKCRREGVGHALVQELLSLAQDGVPEMQTCHVFANARSKELFVKAGGIFAGYREPAERTGCNYAFDLSISAGCGNHAAS